MTKPLSFLTAIVLLVLPGANAQNLNTSPGYSVECIVTDSILSKYDTLVQVNLILQLNEKLLKEAVKVHVTATKDYGSLRKRTATYNLEGRPVINDLNYVKKVDAVLDNKVKTKDLKSRELVYTERNTKADSLQSVSVKNMKTDTPPDVDMKGKKDSLEKSNENNNSKIRTSTIRLDDKVFVLGALQQVKINFGLYKQWESNFNFEIQLEDKQGMLTPIDATSKSVKKDGKQLKTINLKANESH